MGGRGGNVPASLVRTGRVSVTLPAGLTDNYAPTGLENASILKVTPNAGGSSLGGIVAPLDGFVLCIMNVGSGGELNMISQSLTSNADNRFIFLTDIILVRNTSLEIWYDPDDLVWRDMG